MNTTETTWIKMSERKPTDLDFSKRKHVAMHCDGRIWSENVCREDYDGATHWMPIEFTPPTRELTQRERDERAADAYLNKTAFNGGIGYLVRKAHIAGKYDERREVLEALDAALQEKNNSKSMKWGVGSSGEAWSSTMPPSAPASKNREPNNMTTLTEPAPVLAATPLAQSIAQTRAAFDLSIAWLMELSAKAPALHDWEVHFTGVGASLLQFHPTKGLGQQTLMSQTSAMNIVSAIGGKAEARGDGAVEISLEGWKKVILHGAIARFTLNKEAIA